MCSDKAFKNFLVNQTRNNHFLNAYQALASVFVDLNAIFLIAKSESTL
jgi:hypothetical protein